MNGFRVNTTTLSETSAGYNAVSNSLLDSSRHLKAIQETLSTQTIAKDIVELLDSTISLVNNTAMEARELGQQCVMIAEVYERTERKVAAMVDALPLGTTALSTLISAAQNNSALYQEDDFIKQLGSFTPEVQTRVSTHLKPAEPVLLCSNRLPSEGWLMDRAIKATVKNIKG
ncbi:MAG: hypothetical protein FWC32_12970 [Firmicutes bacterium]|nr:hypothetical protein [Bacillota bacterium]